MNYILLVSQNMIVDANNTLNKALEKISLNEINESAVMRLKSNCEAQGISFNHDTSLLKKRVCTISYLIINV